MFHHHLANDSCLTPVGVPTHPLPDGIGLVRHHADARRVDEKLIAAALVDDFRVAGDQGDAGFLAGVPHRGRDARQVGQGQALFQDEPGAEVQRASAAHRQVVDGAVDRQPADVAAGEKDGADDVGVGGEGQAERTELQYRLVVQFGQVWIVEKRQEKLLDKFRGHLAAAAVAHDDAVVVAKGQRAGEGVQVKFGHCAYAFSLPWHPWESVSC